jgi:hypothetical protein
MAWLISPQVWSEFHSQGKTKLKWFLLKPTFFYPRVYAFFCYYRKKERRREIEGKFEFFLKNRCSLEGKRRAVRRIFELKGSRKVMRYLIPLMDLQFIKRFVSVEGLYHLDQALNEGRGVVLMAGHWGNPHLSYNALRVMGYDVTVVRGGMPRKARYPRFQYCDPLNIRSLFMTPLSRVEKKGGGYWKCFEPVGSSTILQMPQQGE